MCSLRNLGSCRIPLLFNKDQNKQTSAVTNDEKYNDEQEDVTGPGTDTVSYGLYEEDGQILDSLDIGKKNGKGYKKYYRLVIILMTKENMDWLSSQTSRQFLSKQITEGTKILYIQNG
ncbi:hypothetical protein KQR56_06755 [Bacillus velezensis]|nr:hypothetical protein [Bacillus velezensis]